MAVDDDGYVIRPNRTAKKRELEAVQELTKILLKLDDRELKLLPLDDELREQIEVTKKTTSHNAKPRQLRFLNSLVAESDYNAIEKAVDHIQKGHRSDTKQFQELETFRDRLVAEGEGAFDDILKRFPKADLKQLKKFLADIERESKKGKPTTAARAVFRYLRQLSAE